MTEANPGDRELHLEYSDPFQSPTERLGSEAGMRRLFLVHFSGPLCGQGAQLRDLSDPGGPERGRADEKGPGDPGPGRHQGEPPGPFAREYHQRAGDYLERVTGYAQQGVRFPFKLLSLVMTDEDRYTCEYCNRKFETIGAWRRHDGRNPRNGEKLAGGAGTAQCQGER